MLANWCSNMRSLENQPDKPVAAIGSRTQNSVSSAQRAHRMLLNSVMTKHGFLPYPQEWWHFTLADEAYPEQYFDFPIP